MASSVAYELLPRRLCALKGSPQRHIVLELAGFRSGGLQCRLSNPLRPIMAPRSVRSPTFSLRRIPSRIPPSPYNQVLGQGHQGSSFLLESTPICPTVTVARDALKLPDSSRRSFLFRKSALSLFGPNLTRPPAINPLFEGLLDEKGNRRASILRRTSAGGVNVHKSRSSAAFFWIS
jgi:hypothetical protein